MIVYIISSNYDYYQETLPRLLRSMQEAQIPSAQVRVFIGRSPVMKIMRQPYGTFFFEQYGAYEHTALIGMVEHEIGEDLVFLLHDTCEVGKNFPALVSQAIPFMKDKFRFTADGFSVNGGMCGFGLYSLNYLMSRFDEIVALKNCDKHAAMVHEGWLLRTKGHIYPYQRQGTVDYETHGMVDVYGTGLLRLKEYYPQVDLYKYKANFGQTNPGAYIEVIK